ncbi:MAG: TIGR04086 family membrane protein [Anaerolineae bacterium]
MNQIRQVSWTAVLWGVLTDFLLTQILGTVAQIGVGIDPNTDVDVAEEMLRASPYFWPATALGILFTGLGGFVAGRIARRGGVFYGALVAFITNILLGLFLYGQPPDDVRTATIMLCFVAGMLGGWLGARSAGEPQANK